MTENYDSIVIQARRKNNMNNGNTASTARSFSNRVPPRKFTAAMIIDPSRELSVNVVIGIERERENGGD